MLYPVALELRPSPEVLQKDAVLSVHDQRCRFSERALGTLQTWSFSRNQAKVLFGDLNSQVLLQVQRTCSCVDCCHGSVEPPEEKLLPLGVHDSGLLYNIWAPFGISFKNEGLIFKPELYFVGFSINN